MTKLTTFTFCACLLGTGIRAVGEEALFRPTEVLPGFYAGSLVVAREQLTKRFLIQYFNDLLKRDNHPLVSVWIYPSNNEAREFWSGKLSDHIPYHIWRKAYDLKKDKPWIMGRFLAIRGSGLLSLAHEDGAVEFVTLGKPDGTGLLSGNGASRILHVNVAAARVTPARSHVVFFIQVRSPLTVKTGADLLKNIGDLPFNEVLLNVRNDSWFIDDFEFPTFYPFEPRREPPTHEEYSNSKMMVCSHGLPLRADSCSVFDRSGFDRP